ncbi:52 kDa protein [red squirrel adenovirus 1]|uniref:52 kDa protein n=1 Tax=red squirrel adenovirus 1 TaxID=2773314 RepID=A0A240FBG1_9ADEN|nr:52 kDa protein [red squirrel adenovirus 1]ARE31882.1 52 kDa protein [red squirrel adenovirus 1]WUG45423.1 52K [Squirrel mastadenovirus A]
MHPVLRQMKPLPKNDSHHSAIVTASNTEPESLLPDEGEGIARLTTDPERHPRVAIKKDASEAYIPRANLARDNEGEYPEGIRDLRLKAGREIRLPRDYKVTDDDFEVPESGAPISQARAHLEAASLATAYQQTVKEERNFQESFNNHVRTLLSREEVCIGLMHLWDFVEAFLTNPRSKSLTAQLFLIVSHARDDGIFKESLLNIAEPEGRWLLDLINVLQSIIVQEHNLPLSEKVAAVNYAAMSLGRFYARKIYDSPFVPLDKEVKVTTFYMRMILKILTLSDDIGIYRNERMQRVVSSGRTRELSDVELMRHLRRALTNGDGHSVTPRRHNPSDDDEEY